MTDGQGPQGIDLKHLQERLLGWARVLLGSTGTAALGMTILYGLGFIVANVSLARHGVFEFSLVREHCLAAGLSFSVFSLLTVLIGWAVIGWLIGRLEALGDWLKVRMQWRWTERARAVYDKACKIIAFRPRWVFLPVLAMAAIAFVWLRAELEEGKPLINFGWFQMGAAPFLWGYVFAVVGGICATSLGTVHYAKLLRRGEGAQTDIPMLIRLVVVIVVLLLSALISYGGWVYPHIAQSLGGGSPVFVEFIVKGEAVSMLETLGMTVGEGGLTERVEYLGQSADKVIVVTQWGDAVSFDAALVEASSFLPVNYYASADKHVDLANWYRGHGELEKSIGEYKAALLIDSESVEALVGIGAVYTDQYVKEIEGLEDSATETQELIGLRETAEGNLRHAGENAPDDGRPYYELARLYAQRFTVWDAAPELKDAIRRGAVFRTRAMQQPDFDAGIKASERLRRALYTYDGELVKGYEDLGDSLYAEGQVEDALHAYGMAADLAQILLVDDLRSAENHAQMARIYTETKETGNAIDEYRKATELYERNARYRYELAALYYAQENFDDVITECSNGIISIEGEGWTDDFQVHYHINLYLLRGHAHREMELWTQAISDYEQAAGCALKEGLGTFAAKAFYHLARLEMGRPEGSLDLALTNLEKAIWLDQELATSATEELDFAPLRENREEGFQYALAPPMIERIEASDTLTITFHLREPRGDFVRKLMVLTELAGLKSLVTYSEEEGEWVGVEAHEDFEISEDGLRYDFYLKEDAVYTAEELRSRLSELLGLEH